MTLHVTIAAEGLVTNLTLDGLAWDIIGWYSNCCNICRNICVILTPRDNPIGVLFPRLL